jgi:hypothetical protein
MGSNGQQIAAILPQGAKGPAHVKGINQFNAEADWQGEPKNWGGIEGGAPWFGVLTENWWFKGNVKITFKGSDGKTEEGWNCPNVRESSSDDFWTTSLEDPDGHQGPP